jgi:hypothetical protein
MKGSRHKPSALLRLTAILWICALNCKFEAATYLSNLDNLWTHGGIGDFHGLFPGGSPYGTDTVRFTTGPGRGFSINALTFEFDSNFTSAAQWVNVQLFQQSSGLLLGSFGNPVLNPNGTHYSGYTRYIDFSPLAPIQLQPFTEYSVFLSVPANSPTATSLLFTDLSDYTSQAVWIMGPTITGNPYANGEYLKMAVDATLVPEANTVVFLFGGLLALIGCRQSIIGETRKSPSQPHCP